MSKISNLVNETARLEEQITELTEVYNKNLAKIEKYFEKTNSTEVVCEDESGEGGRLKAVKTKRSYIKYFPDKLKEALPKDIYEEVVKKTYTINDIDKMTSLVKKAGVSPKEFKNLIDIDIKPNTEAIKQKFKIGEITIDNLRDAYELKVIKKVEIVKG
jgi:hypothetical protein